MCENIKAKVTCSNKILIIIYIIMKQHIFILFIGRTGSTYLMQIFNCCKNSKVLCDYGEIFTSINAIMKTFNADTKFGIGESEYKNYALTNPIQYINFIEENIQQDMLFSKIQIPYLITKDIDTISQILNRHDCKLIIIRRNLLHSYISHKKAEHFDKWSKVDTTSTKLKINLQNFLDYYNKTTKAYISIINLIKHKNVLFLEYEQIHKLQTEREKIDYILDKVKLIGLELEFDKPDGYEFLFKQDKNKKISDKILNYHDLKAFLIKKNLGYLLVDEHS